jgi:hypothetical protein
MSPKTAPHRQPVPTLVTLSNARRPRRPAGIRTAVAVDPFASHAAAAVLLAPLALPQPLSAGELDDLKALADETRAITDALVSNSRPAGIGTLNRLAAQTSATRTLLIERDGTLVTDERWQAASALAELARRVVDELGRLDPVRLRHCSREACDLLFYDITRPGTQRWHSESPCGLRERQERWRKTAAH